MVSGFTNMNLDLEGHNVIRVSTPFKIYRVGQKQVACSFVIHTMHEQ